MEEERKLPAAPAPDRKACLAGLRGEEVTLPKHPVLDVERYLAKLCEQDAPLPEHPALDVERYLAKLCGEDVTLPEHPALDVERYLAKLCGEAVELPDHPVTDVERYLAKLCGEDVELPEHPNTDIERYLAWWCEHGGGGYDVTVTGTLPLTLSNSLAAALRRLARCGKCEQDGAPTPTSPVDIVCNNGAIRYSRNLLDPSASNITIGINFNEYGSPYESPNNWCTDYIPVVGGKTYAFWGRAKADHTVSAYNRIFWYAADKTNISPRPPYTINTVTVGTAPSNAAYARLSSSCYNSLAPITRETFDLYNWMFADTAIEIPYQPYVEGGIYTDGTPEVLTVRGKNLFDKAAQSRMYYYNNNGEEAQLSAGSSRFVHSAKIPCKPNTAYTVSGISVFPTSAGSNAYYYKVTFWDAEGNFLSYSNGDPVYNGAFVRTDTTPANCAYIAFNSFTTDINVQLEEGSTATDYQPCAEPQTASVPMLLSVGDHKDEAELIGGLKTVRAGVRVLDGTETNWTFDAAYDRAILRPVPDFLSASARNIQLACTHFVSKYNVEPISALGVGDFYNATGNGFVFHVAQTGLDDWKAFLAAQFAAGTPVIVLYPLATPATEQITPQALNSCAGTTIVDTECGVEPADGEAEYKASAAPAEAEEGEGA